MIRFANAFILYPLLEKFGHRDVRTKLQEIKRFERLTADEKDAFRKKKLFDILSHSRKNIPYYKDLFEKVSFDESSILKDIRHIEKLPVLTKNDVRENGDRMRMPNAHHVRKTGGSTGQSVFFYYDNDGLDWAAALNLWAYELAGNYLYRSDCHIASELEFPPLQGRDRALDFLKLSAQNRKRIMIRSFSDHDMDATFSQLKKYRPYLIQGHPSTGYAIANYIRAKDLPKKSYCKVFEPSGEMLTDKMAEAISEYLGCKVVNRYGNAEFGVMAHSRPQDTYKKLQVFNSSFHIEDVEKGPIVVSGFTNYAFPLFRYDTGDIASVRREGEDTFIHEIQGRIHDLVRIEDEDYATHFIMDYLDHKIRGIREFQILVRDEKPPLLNIVPENDGDKDRIRTALKQRWPKGLDIDFIPYGELQTVGWRQKFRHVIDQRKNK